MCAGASSRPTQRGLFLQKQALPDDPLIPAFLHKVVHSSKIYDDLVWSALSRVEFCPPKG